MSRLGPCCGCERTARVRNVLLLDYAAAIPGRGWGCVVCGLPADRAVAVLCDRCRTRYEQDASTLRFFCTGYPASDGRTPIAKLTEAASHRHGPHGDVE